MNFWMCFAGLVFLAAGIVIQRKEIAAARGLEKLIALRAVLIAASLAAFAPEHFQPPAIARAMVPSWMPGHGWWAWFVGCALLAAAISLTLRKFERLSCTLLGLMLLLFVCMVHVPNVVADPHNRTAWTCIFRDSSFAAGALALAGVCSRSASPRQARAMILFGQVVLAVAAVFYGIETFLHLKFAPGVPLELKTPAWVPLPSVWGGISGTILLVAGLALALNKKPRTAAAAIGALMTACTVFLYLPMLVIARNGSAGDVTVAINYVADTLLAAGAALAVASAMRVNSGQSEKE